MALIRFIQIHMKGITVKKLAYVLAVLAFVVTAPAVRAQPELDFTIPALGNMGTITYAGGANPLVGSNILVSSVAGLSTPANPGTSLNITGGRLDFTTGSPIGPNTWAGGTLTVTGGTSAASGTLLGGTFSTATVTGAGGGFMVAIAGFTDPVNPGLAAFFGLPTTPYVGSFFVGFNGTAAANGAITSSQVLSGDIATHPVPGPGFLVLLCSGGAVSLLGCAWRRARKAAA